MLFSSFSRRNVLDRATQSVRFEQLEDRRLMAVDTIQSLPFALDFAADRSEVVDKDGQGTGFTRVQENKNASQYQAGLIDLDTAAGVLRLTTTGTSAAGTNYETDNTLVNALETQFDATTKGWSINTRLVGPLTYMTAANHQGGLMFGPDQDNYVKFVAVITGSGPRLQFIDEQANGTGGFIHSINASQNIGSFASISTLDLRLVGDATIGKVVAFYAINGGAFVKLSTELTLTGTKRAQFFTSSARGGITAAAKNNLPSITVTFDSFDIQAGAPVTQPQITATRPGNGNTNVSRDAFVAADIFLPTPGAGVDASTLTSQSVKLYKTSDGTVIAGVLNTSGGGDAIVLQPTQLLDANTSYTFEITSEVKDTSGAGFQPYTMTFITGVTGGETNPSLAFEKVTLQAATGQNFTSLQIGPDGKLYASTITGLILRFGINGDGTLGSPQTIASVQTGNAGAMRFVTGIVFDPASTANNLILWVSHGEFTFENASDWTGKVSRLTGVNLENYVDGIVGLSRSMRDHLNNQLSFGPDGALYFTHGSNTAMGAPDNAWGLRPERKLTAAVLRFDTTQYSSTPINVKTEEGGTYNPDAPGAPLKVFASGVRNAFDLLFHSNGQLYVPTNGSAANGATPASPDGTVPAINPVTQTESDWLFRVEQGGYYGHPNPARGQYVFNGGNPTGGADVAELPQYPVGTQPDANYRGYAFEFGKNYSPNGLIEYKGNAFAGQLNGKIMVVRYSGGDDIIVLSTGPNGEISQVQSGIAGLTHLVDPLDLVEDTRTGYVYVSEYGAGRITLLRPITPGANITINKDRLIYNDVQTASGNSPASPNQTITITNTGTAALAMPIDGLQIIGTNASEFLITQNPGLPLTLQPGQSVTVGIAFRATSVGIRVAQLQIKSNDPDNPTTLITLRGVGTTGKGGTNEPSLQRILDLHQIPINVGDPNPADTAMPYVANSPNDEILGLQKLIKADSGPVSIQVLASFGFTNNGTTSRVGYYQSGTPASLTKLFEISKTDEQTVAATPIGTTSFDPGSAEFSLYSSYPGFNAADNFSERVVYSEDTLNTWETTASLRHKVRYYQFRNTDGSIVPNAYVVAFEEFTGSYDYQDVVMIVRNVQPAPAGPEIGISNQDVIPFADRLVFNRFGTIDTSISDQKETATLRIRNTGATALVISSLNFSGPFQLNAAVTLPLTINPVAANGTGGFADIVVRFTATTGKLHTGTLTIGSNDSTEPSTVVQLSGLYRAQPEANIEATLQEFVDLFGYKTNVNQALVGTQGGKVERSSADEILSPFWQVADTSRTVEVTQLAAFHRQNLTASFSWYRQGSSGTRTSLFTHSARDGQTILPNPQGSSTGLSRRSFSPGTTQAFGLWLDGYFSEDSLNPQEQAGGGYGHAVRFYVARDRAGDIIPNTYIVALDYTGQPTITNFDYQDNILIVSNLKPVSGPGTPASLTASSGPLGISLNWSDNIESNVAGYNVYRSASAGGTFTKLNSSPQNRSDFDDIFAPAGIESFYRVTAVDLNGTESAAATVSAVREQDLNPPAQPANLVATGTASGNTLDWTDNAEADLAGYNVYRSDSVAGTYVKLNATPLTTSVYTDLTAPVGAESFYRITAIDIFSNESTPALASAVRTGGDTVAPASPTNVTAVGSGTGIFLNWDNNTELDLAGYNVFRSTSVNSGFVKINSSIISQSQYNDVSAPEGVTLYYRVTAVDQSANQSPAVQISAVRPDVTPPGIPSGLTASGSLTAINLDWNDGTASDLAGYNVYRAAAAAGPFEKLNLAGLLTSSLFADTTATSGQTMYYRVTAVDVSGNESDFATATGVRAGPDTTAPTAPTILTLTPGVNGNTLDWADNTEADLAGYNVYRAGTVDGPYTRVNSGLMVASTFVDSSITPGLVTYYRVTAVDATGNESGPINGSVLNLPAAPQNLAAQAGGTSQIALNWGNVTGEDSYLVERSANGTTSWAQIGTTSANVTTYTDTGLPAGTAFYYRVRSMNASGQSDVSNVTTNNTAPVASYASANIGNVGGAAGSTTELVVGNSYNITGGGADVWGTADGFRFVHQQVSGDFDFRVRVAALTAPNDFSMAGLMARTSLDANSSNAFVKTRRSTQGLRFTTRTTTAGETSGQGGGSVNFPNQWLRLQRNGNQFTGYASVDGVNWVVTGTVTLNLPQTVFFGMAVSVKATSGTATAQFRDLSSLAPLPTVPTVPAGTTAVAASGSAVNVNWNDSTGETGYRIERSLNGINAWAEVGNVGANVVLFSDSGLTSGTTYFYRVRAQNAQGFSVYSNVASATTASAPSAASGLTATTISTSQINLGWVDNSSTETGFRIERKIGAAGTWQTLATVGAGVTSASDVGLVAGTTYFYRIVALNAAGEAPASNEASATTTSAGPTQTPFLGSPFAVGQRIEAENFDEGGQGIAFSDADTTQRGTGGAHRTTAVDLGISSDTGGGYNLGFTQAGEWLEYTVNIGQAGNYDFAIRVASGGQGGTFHIEFDGVNKTGPITVNTTGGWQTWATLVRQNIALSAGVQIMRIVMDSTGSSGAVANMNWLEITPRVAVPPTPGYTALPPLIGATLGTPTLAGSTNSLNEETSYNIAAGGTDIWDRADQGHFAYTAITGDFDIRVRVESLTQTDAWAKAGLMARTSLDTNSANIFLLATPSGTNAVRLQTRSVIGGSTTSTGTATGSYPNTWLRLARTGNTFVGYVSTNGTNWTQVSQSTVALGSTVFVGLAATSHKASTATTAAFRELGRSA